MITINNSTVAVESSTELKNILENDNSISLIYLAKDITLTQGIDILGSKKNITIDGLYPRDGSGTIHTYTDMNSSNSSDTLGVRTSSNINITIQNMNVIGRNYYGIIYVSETSDHQNVIVTYKNLTYSGPQITYHPSGKSIYINVNITIVDSTACVANEVAETHQLQIGGTNIIKHNSSGDSTFWFRGFSNNSYLELLENCNLSISTTKDIVYTSYYLKVIINKNANFNINTKYGFFRDSSHQASSIFIDENSSLSIIQQQRFGGYPTITCRDSFTINNNAILYIQANFDNAGPLLRFSTSSTFNINNPKSIILYSKTSSCLSIDSNSVFNISCKKLDYWLISPSLISTGIIPNNPIYSWYKKREGDLLSIKCNVTSSKTTITSNNLTPNEISTLPNLNLLQFQKVNTLRFLNSGTLELNTVPTIIEFQRPIVNEDPLILGRKNKNLSITITDSRALSSNWYLYAYIEEPLINKDNTYSLPDSLIFVDKNGSIQLLSSKPILIYAGESNSGNTKKTVINWDDNKGILFKIDKPLYNGETYSTFIHWILTTEKLN